MLNGNPSSVTISLEHARSTSKTTTGVSTISLVISRGSYEARVSFVKTADGPFDVCLGLVWFIALLKGDPDDGERVCLFELICITPSRPRIGTFPVRKPSCSV